jgi:hypothetical protein
MLNWKNLMKLDDVGKAMCRGLFNFAKGGLFALVLACILAAPAHAQSVNLTSVSWIASNRSQLDAAVTNLKDVNAFVVHALGSENRELAKDSRR